MTTAWLGQAPTDEVLGFLFGVCDATASRACTRPLPTVDTGRPVGVISVRGILRNLTAFCSERSVLALRSECKM